MFGKKHLLLFVLCAAGMVFAAKNRIEFFHEPGCEECEEIEKQIFPKLEPRFEIVRRDIGMESNLVYLLNLEHQAGYPGPERAYLVLNGRHVFGNPLNSPPEFFQWLEQHGCSEGMEPSPSAAPDSDPVRARFEQMTLPVVLLAGLLDGINPCAISTLAFFMSLLAVSTRRRQGYGGQEVRNRQLILLGLSFCLASFMTYLAIGFGLLRFIHLFSGFTVLRNAMEWGMAALLLLFACLSFRDAIRFHKSQDGHDVTLQLSTGMKKRIQSVMRRGLKTGHLILGGLFIGTLVTALESVCTGQVYVPTLVLILKNSALAEFRAWLYLIAYNLLFILPLILIFTAVYLGLQIETLLCWSRKNVTFSKTLLGLFFLLMAALFVFL